MAAFGSNHRRLQEVPLWSVLLAVACVARVAIGKEFPVPKWSNGTLKSPWRMHTLFSVECHVYFDWQTVGIMHSFRKSGQPGPVTRLLSCTDEQLQGYRGMDLAPTHEVPSMSQHPVTGDWYTLYSVSLHFFSDCCSCCMFFQHGFLLVGLHPLAICRTSNTCGAWTLYVNFNYCEVSVLLWADDGFPCSGNWDQFLPVPFQCLSIPASFIGLIHSGLHSSLVYTVYDCD